MSPLLNFGIELPTLFICSVEEDLKNLITTIEKQLNQYKKLRQLGENRSSSGSAN